MAKDDKQARGVPLDAVISLERARVEARREGLDRVPIDSPRGAVRGLALSGGGIRSATLCLGIMQALAIRSPASPSVTDPAAESSWLAEFDYLSTVSGGGYTGAFFVSLFVPQRLQKEQSDATAVAHQAYDVLRRNPPRRIRSTTVYEGDSLLDAPLAWLRENGRYLTPTGGGDYVYAAAVGVRNWFAVQYVIATVLLTAMALVALVRVGLSEASPGYRAFERLWLPDWVAGTLEGIWWSPLWMLSLLVVFLWQLPTGIAFWLTHPPRDRGAESPPRLLPVAAVIAFLIGVVGWVAAAAAYSAKASIAAAFLFGAGSLAVFAFVLHVITASRREVGTIADQRVMLTRWLATGFKLLAAVLLVAVIDTLGQTLYLLQAQKLGLVALSSAPIVGVLVALFRYFARQFDQQKTPSWFSRVPGELLALFGAALIFLLIASLHSLLTQWVVWRGELPGKGVPVSVLIVGVWSVALVLAAFITGQFSGFLNLSTFQSFYGARLTRAYLGASNGTRFATKGEANLSVAEPVTGDHIRQEAYYTNELAPLHLINVTMNQTIDPAEQLVQRDRKGKPVALSPLGFSIDDRFFTSINGPKLPIAGGKATEELSIGPWIGISGAAVTTGLGRATSLGTSLALGFANVRLGYWWSSGYGQDDSRGLLRPFRLALKWAFKTQAFLFNELMGKFSGLHREWQYLSDGGHFENTGLYELLRPGRDLKLIVVCDNGCDPLYRFGDLANLIRLARIDFGLDIDVDREVVSFKSLDRVFGLPSDFASDARSDKCALMLRVYHGKRAATPDCRIIVLKPRVIVSATADVHEYKLTEPAFPQQATADQFFDEAQWESYRALGFAIGESVFGPEHAKDLDEYLSR